jgi:hypothetical protein
MYDVDAWSAPTLRPAPPAALNAPTPAPPPARPLLAGCVAHPSSQGTQSGSSLELASYSSGRNKQEALAASEVVSWLFMEAGIDSEQLGMLIGAF